jgi:amino acid adenylation domain-containing protein
MMEREFFIFRTSFAQQRLWFLDQYEPNSSVYNIPSAQRLRGTLDVAILERSLNEIIRRHESLRTTFSMVDGEPVQVIAPSVNLSLPIVDLSDQPETEREEEARRLAHEEARHPFDLSTGPLFRATLIRLAHDDHILVLTMHHIVSDGWSMGVFHRELSVLYRAFTNGEPSPLADLPIQYADYAVWQREWLQGEVLDRQLSYWEKQLEGVPAVLNLPTDHPRSAVQTYRGNRQSIEVTRELTQALKALSRKEGVTLFMTLLAAFQTLLYRYTGQEDIVVGSPIANRNRTEIEGLIGFVVNTLVLRSNFSGNPRFTELLGRVREMALGAYAHQDLPFEKLVEELQPERSVSHSPLFQVMFVLQNTPSATLELQGLTVKLVPVGGEAAKFDLTLSIHEVPEGLEGSLQYNIDLFDAATIKRMFDHFQTLLESIVADPEQQISDLPILTQAEQRQLLVEWNDTEKDYPSDKCIHELFEAQAEQSPDAVAVAFEDQQLSYRELNARANQLAHYLQELGVGPEVLVGFCVERSLEMVIGLLGILKAGGAYVPLDPEYPKERLAFMLEDAQVSILLSQKRLIEDGRLNIEDRYPLSSVLYSQMKVVCLDRDLEEIAQQSQENPTSGITSTNVAYVIYTSGSTGKPKGVTVENRQLINYSLDIIRRLEPAAGDNFAMVQPLTVDSCVTMIFPCLLTGGALHVISREKAISPSELGDYFRRWPIDFLKIAPSHLAALEASSYPEQFMPHRCLIIGGEESRWDWVRSLRALAPGSAVFNHYGPTETTVGVLMYRVHDEDPSQNYLKTPLGRPISNIQVFLLNARLQPVPIGILGELYIGGDNLARGYLNRPELTAERFVPNPFSVETGARLYRTGDRARYLPDGNIEFLGRTDHQLKIRGFRIEPGEIEAVLIQHPGVEQVIVTPWGETPEQQRLVAYVVLHQARAPSAAELRDFLKKKLPEYMVPSALTLLDVLPRTPHGKLDRKALPAPNQSRPEMEERYVAPRTPVEELLAEIWAEVLKLDKVGIHDNFFGLGGHSLLAIQVISRIREGLLAELPLRRLFETPTVAGVAEHVESARQKTAGFRALPMVSGAVDGECLLSFSQERFWFLEQLGPNNLAYHVTYDFRLIGPLNIEALEKTLAETVRRHESLRTTFHLRNGKPVQVISERWSSPLKIIDLRQQTRANSEAEVERLVENERQEPFDLSADLLLRATLLQLGADEHVLILSTHHIAWDHWSIEILFREFAILYQASAAGKPSPLPDPTIQYKHYALWQRKVFDRAELQNHLTYWKERLHDAPQTLNLPTDHPRKPLHNRRGERQSVALPERLSDELKALSRRSGVTFFMLVLAAFQTLLHRITGQDDIVVGTPVAGRDRSETEGLIGLFLNTLVLRTKLCGNPTFFQLLQKVREVALGAYDHQDLPFEKLVEELQPERDLSRTPIFQVFVNMYNFKEASFQLDQLRVDRVNVSKPVPQFDLELYVRERDDGTHLTLVYDSDLFDFATIAGMLGQYRHLLEQIVAEPEKPIESYSLVTPESRSLLPDPSAVLAEPPQQLVTSIFTSWAQQTPDAPAVNQGRQTWTYDELAEGADNLARLLRASGLERGDVVAICGRRSFGLIASMIGVLLSGGVLLPIDHTLPNQRKQLMLKEARAKVLLYVGDKRSEDAWLAEDLVPGILIVDLTNACVVDPGAGLNSEPVSLPEVSPDDPAYIFFTSGTTGIPKGVLGCHKGLSHFLNWQRETFGIEPRDRSAQLTALSFDAVLRDIFLPLTSGATLCLPEFSDTFGPDETIGWLEREQISVLHTVPSVAQSWLANSAEKISLPSLRRVFFVGEPLTDTLVLRWRAAFQNAAEIVNLYGPTETTLVKCFYQVPIDLRPGVQPVGHPIPQVQALVLAQNNQLCGINEPGEIVLRTPFRSLGYINAPEENRMRFVKNPFRDDAHDLVYFTGDAGRYAPDGTLEILGRLDDQIKIRGVRIEPAEVTAILAQHPLVDSCIVVAKKNADDDSSLVAYLVASKQGQPTSTQLRSYLLEQLPVAMLPSAFVLLDSLPLTSNGKVDRKALAALDPHPPEPEDSFVAPRTGLEEILVTIWIEILKRQRIGIHDNFFDLGGHSLLATQVVSRIRQALEVRLPLRALFEKPTVAGLSDHIECARWTGTEDSRTSGDDLGEMEEIIL